ncbi:MAG TPA: cupin domain-containing protein [Rhodocyclaceae bacterium]|nr:cupin domain-containing protein [Rhodocyclaceae bacterium]
MAFTLIHEPAARATFSPDKHTKTVLYNDDALRVVLFGFEPGQGIAEHTSSMPAIVQVVHGELEMSFGAERAAMKAGAWVHLPPQLPHGLHARTRCAVLLTLAKGGQ